MLSSRLKLDLEVHFGLLQDAVPVFLQDKFLCNFELEDIIHSTNLPVTGHELSTEFAWLEEDDYCICQCDSMLMSRQCDDSYIAKYYKFGKDGELLTAPRVEGFGPPITLFDTANIHYQFCPPTLVRARNEVRPLSGEEAWGCMSALIRAFVSARASLCKDTDEQALDDLHNRALHANKLATVLRSDEMGYAEEGLAILCERYAFRMDQIRYQLEGKKQKEAHIGFIGPCVACFELMFGQPATGGSDYKPSPFTRFVTSFLDIMDVPTANWRTVRKYFQKWRKLGHHT
jgi:hypothetical protein